MCKDPNVKPLGPCACREKECELNKEDHECVDRNGEEVPLCGCEDEECEVTREEERKKREKLVLGV